MKVEQFRSGSVGARMGFLLYLLCCLGLALAAGEYGLRALYPHDVEPVYEFDAKAIAAPRKNYAHMTAEGWWQTNSLGARGAELDVVAETILVLGDSNIAARFAAERDTFPVRLAALTSMQVANLGVPGYGPDQSVARLETVLAQTVFPRLRAVVLQVFADNDLGDLIRNALPRFDGREDGAVWQEPIFSYLGNLTGRSLMLRKARNGLLRTGLGAWMSPANYYPPPSVARWDFGPAMIGTLVAEQRRSFQEYRKRKFTAWYLDYYDAAIALDVDPQLTKSAVGILGRVFHTFADLSRKYGFCPLVLIQPSEVDVAKTFYITADDMSAYGRRHGHSYEPRRLSRLVEQAASDAALPLIALFDAFQGGTFYYSNTELPGDNHWNPAGMEEAARLTASYLTLSCGQD